MLRNLINYSRGWSSIYRRGVSSTASLRIPLPPTIEDDSLSPFGESLTYEPSLEMPSAQAPITTLSDPRDHTPDQLSLWYTIPDEDLQTYFGQHVLPFQYMILKDTFNEAGLMIRKPALSVINYIKQLRLDTITPPKFIFYGRYGAGKSCCMGHVSHFLAKEEFVLLQVPWVTRWLKQFRKHNAEIVQSSSVPGRFDHTTDAADWLKFFKMQNVALIEKQQLTIIRDYRLTTREGCTAGSSLMSLVDLGIGRPRLAAECVVALTTELRGLATDGRCKVGVVMDGINGMFTESSVYQREEDQKSFIEAKEFTLVQAFVDMMNDDWCGGVIVGSVDQMARPADERENYMPRALLEGHGWNTLDPFVAVPVAEYNDTEFNSAMSYYGSKHWIQRDGALSEQGRDHLAVVTGRNPCDLVEAISGL